MAMPAHPTEWTVEMVRALPDDGNRYEVIDGELFVTSAPTWNHQRAVRELAYLLGPYVRDNGVGDLIFAPADVVFGPRNMVEPDLFAVPLVNGAVPRTWEEVGRLVLAVEVLSPSTSRTDRREKRELYPSVAARTKSVSTSGTLKRSRQVATRAATAGRTAAGCAATTRRAVPTKGCPRILGRGRRRTHHRAVAA